MPRYMPVHVTQADAIRLQQALQRETQAGASAPADELEAVLDEAVTVPGTDIGPDVITMNSRVVIASGVGGAPRTVTLSYPREAAADAGRVSVLSPLGRVLLGARVGDELQVALPGGPPGRLRVIALEYQPEAAGHFDR